MDSIPPFLNPVMSQSQSMHKNGVLIREFNLGSQPRGERRLYWDGKKIERGETVASGIYFYAFSELAIPTLSGKCG